MIKRICDRCGREVASTEEFRVLDLTYPKTTSIQTLIKTQICAEPGLTIYDAELCHGCSVDLISWMEEGEKRRVDNEERTDD